MTKYPARLVADYFLATGHVHEAPVTNLKIQKLLYYAQGFHLAICGPALFDEQVRAWAHGPVVADVYHHFKVYGRDPIRPPTEDEFSWDYVDDETEEFLDDIWEEFGQFSAWRLREMTHAEPPWKEARARGRRNISRRSLKRHFQTRS